MVVGIEISATHHRSARDGEVTAVATLAHGGRTLATYDIVITDSAGRRVCTSRLTCLIRDRAPGRDGNGADPLGGAGAEQARSKRGAGAEQARAEAGAAIRRSPFAPRGGGSLTW